MPLGPHERAGRAFPGRRYAAARRASVLLLLGVVLVLPAFLCAEGAPEVHLDIFLSSTCPHCDLVQEPALKKLGERLHCAVRPHYHDIDSLAELKRLVALEERVGDTDNELPVVFMGEHVLGGNAEIEAALEPLLKQYRTSGLPAIELPPLEEATPAAGEVQTAGPAIYLAYFESPGCRECDRAYHMLRLLQSRHADLSIRRIGAASRDALVLLEAVCARAGVPPERRLLVPAVFVGDRALIKEKVTDRALEALVAARPEGAARRPWDVTENELAQARSRLAHRASSVTLAAVVGGGLIDGVNPCAFATIAFLVLCLSGMGAARGRIVSVGLGFTAGVFVAYFLAGLALWEALRGIDLLPYLGRAVTWIIIAAVLVLSVLSFRDARLALAGKAGGMALKLPAWLRRRINAVIARRLHAGHLVAGAFVLGVIVSALEFVCTGQVYVPLIRFMTAAAETRMRGMALLLLYDAAFVVPLIGVFAAVYFGVRSESLSAAFRRHVVAEKVALGLFFGALAGLLLHVALVGS